MSNAYRGRDRATSLAQRIAGQPAVLPDDPANYAIRIDYARAFDRLSASDQEVLKLVAWDGLSIAESAQVLDVSNAAFSARLSRARKDRKSTRLNSSHVAISYAVFCLKKKKMQQQSRTTAE